MNRTGPSNRALLQNGMPSFGDVLNKDQTDAIQSFLIELAWMAYSGQSTDRQEPTMTSQ